jgi:mono/diheme cytochrome c family protein
MVRGVVACTRSPVADAQGFYVGSPIGSALGFLLGMAMMVCMAAVAAGEPAPLEAFFERHCYGCHSGKEPEAGLDLAVLSRDVSDPNILRRFVRIHDRIAQGEMPPKESEQPTAAEIATVTQWLDAELFRADSERIAKAGRARMRRMTRAEYENTLCDLLALSRLDIQGMLPADGRVAGYEKIGDGLDVSPAHLAAYAAAAEKALTAAIATRSTPPPVFKRRIYPAGLFKFGGNLIGGNFVLLKDGKPDPALPIRGGFENIKGYVATPGADDDLKERGQFFKDNAIAKSQSTVGLIEANLGGREAGLDVAPIYDGLYRLRFSIWGFQWNRGTVEPSVSQALAVRAHAEGHQQEGGRLLATLTAASLAPREHEITTWIDAHETLVIDPVSIANNRGNSLQQIGGRSAGHVGPGVALDWFEVEGPIEASWPPESHRRLFGDLPIAPLPVETGGLIPPLRQTVRSTGGHAPNFYVDIPPADRKPSLETVTSSTPLEDARRLFTDFLPRAFRRPVEPAEIDPYVALVEKRLAAKDCFEDAMRRAYVAILTSPEFLFHPADVQKGDSHLFVLASRLSYWLWNSPPDDTLLAAAAAGRLADPAVLHAEVDRLLADPRSDRFLQNFTDQWLELHRIDETNPDRKLYPEYSFLLHEGMAAEPRAFLRELIAKDLPIHSLVDADFAMLTQRLAEHYGIMGVDGVEVRRVAVPKESHRGGLLGQAAIHKVTANGTTTTPVKRGVWVLDRLLNDPAPPPPPGIAGIDPDTRGATTIREQLALHRTNAGCAACHAKIDPPGFALECFDPIGGYRDRYRSTDKGDQAPEADRLRWEARYKLGPAVDASGEAADGRRFTGIDSFKQLLADDPAGLARAFVGQMARYATGAELSYADRRTIEEIVATAAPTQYGVRSLMHAIAASRLLPGAR